MNELVFATNNQHKLAEARRITSGICRILSLADIGCSEEIPETGTTLEANALQKAHWIKDKYGYDCFADDTGLMVDSLNGRPGVYSARYAGPGCTPADNVSLLLSELAPYTDIKSRGAHFATVIAYVTDEGDHLFRGEVEGHISLEPDGNGGFGYDPVFVPIESGQSFASMTADAKNAISHRGRAMRKFIDWLASR